MFEKDNSLLFSIHFTALIIFEKNVFLTFVFHLHFTIYEFVYFGGWDVIFFFN